MRDEDPGTHMRERTKCLLELAQSFGTERERRSFTIAAFEDDELLWLLLAKLPSRGASHGSRMHAASLVSNDESRPAGINRSELHSLAPFPPNELDADFVVDAEIADHLVQDVGDFHGAKEPFWRDSGLLDVCFER